MIIQELVDYYEYLQKNQPDAVVQRGWSQVRISCFVNIDQRGNLLGLVPVGDKSGLPRAVPEQVKRSSGIAPNFLCDTPAYLLGFDAKGKPERALRCFEASKALHVRLLSGVDSIASRATCMFFEKWQPENAAESSALNEHLEVLLSGRNLAFMVEGVEVVDDSAIRQRWLNSLDEAPDENSLGRCLATGRMTKIARLHPVVKGVVGGQSMGTSLVSFNEPSFSSYGHDGEQGFNAPVGEYAAFAYATALNYLIADRRHHIRLGDTTIVYWAGASDAECTEVVCGLFGGFGIGGNDLPDEDPDEVIDSIMNEVRLGKWVKNIDPGVPFYVLGVAPNAARLSVRFFERSTFGQVIDNLAAHYGRLEIAHAPFEPKYLSPYRLLKAVAPPKSKQDPATSVLGGSFMRSILYDRPYPAALYHNALMRTFATKDDAETRTQKVSYERAAIMKAYLIKNVSSNGKEFTVSLDKSRDDAAYVLGRLFAVFERIQKRANPDLNATIKDRYFNSACTTPNVVFPTLAKLSEKHLTKLQKDSSVAGAAVNFSKELGELYGKLDAFPKRLSLDEQGAFVIGYQHQRQDFFDRVQNQ